MELLKASKSTQNNKTLGIGDVNHRYFKCNKCSAIAKTAFDKADIVCTTHQPARTSGICGGSFDTEVTEQEYNKE